MDQQLNHYGVLGMKWGKRKASTSSSAKSKNKSTRSKSDDYKEAKSIRKKKPSQMSNSELRKVNERIRLESEYKRLTPRAVKKGLLFIGAAAGTTNTVLNLYNNSDKLIGIGKQFVKRYR